MNLQLKEYQDKINEMKTQSEEKKKMEKERQEVENQLKKKIEQLEIERAKKKQKVQEKYKQSEVVTFNDAPTIYIEISCSEITPGSENISISKPIITIQCFFYISFCI